MIAQLYLFKLGGLCFSLNTLCLQITVAPPNTADLGTDEKAAVFGNRK